jgi:hypothetical protein
MISATEAFPECVLPGHDPVRAAIEAGEVVEAERLAIDEVFPPAESPVMRRMVRFQVATFVARRADDRHALEEYRREIEPLLVGEEAARDVGRGRTRMSAPTTSRGSGGPRRCGALR